MKMKMKMNDVVYISMTASEPHTANRPFRDARRMIHEEKRKDGLSDLRSSDSSQAYYDESLLIMDNINQKIWKVWQLSSFLSRDGGVCIKAKRCHWLMLPFFCSYRLYASGWVLLGVDCSSWRCSVASPSSLHYWRSIPHVKHHDIVIECTMSWASYWFFYMPLIIQV